MYQTLLDSKDKVRKQNKWVLCLLKAGEWLCTQDIGILLHKDLRWMTLFEAWYCLCSSWRPGNKTINYHIVIDFDQYQYKKRSIYIAIRDRTTESSSWVCYTNTVPYLFTIFECLSLLYRHWSIYQWRTVEGR